MYIKNLALVNFRNYEKLELQLENKLYILVGKNAQGKTNLLESVYLTCIGKSPKTQKEKEMIYFDAPASKITVNCAHLYGDNLIEFYLRRNEKKCVYVNKMPLQKMGQLMGRVNCVYFSPDELKLIKDCPEDRRRFMDISLCQMTKTYFYKLSKVIDILNQRNKLLKDKNLSYIKKTLPIWDNELAIAGAEVAKDRYNFIQSLKPIVIDVHNYLTDGSEKIEINYLGFTENMECSVNQLSEHYKNQLAANFEKDFKLGFTTFGVQRDDIKILINNRDVKTYGSQGQHRTVALSLKLSELQTFKEVNKEYPILLLDDVLSELDESRQKKLLNYCKGIQTFLTCTFVESEFLKNANYDILQVKNGKISLNRDK